MNQIYKYPRTHHVEGSKLQPGDEDMITELVEAAEDFLENEFDNEELLAQEDDDE